MHVSNPPEAYVRSVEEQIIALINQDIAERSLVPGDKLLTERAIAARGNFSRPSIRRALAQLAANGIITREVGRGTFLTVKHDPIHNPPSAQYTPSPVEVNSARLLLEPGIVGLAAVTATSDDLREIRRCYEGQKKAKEYDDFELWDAALHRAFVTATHNHLLSEIYRLIEYGRNDPTWLSFKKRTFPKQRPQYQTEHEMIVNALITRDGEAAATAMRSHLTGVARITHADPTHNGSPSASESMTQDITL